MSEQSKSKTTSYAKCQKYQVIVSPNDNLEFTGNFLEGLKAIKSGNKYSATKFLEDFGTHFAEHVNMGSSLTIEKTFESELLTKHNEKETEECKESKGTEFSGMENTYTV